MRQILKCILDCIFSANGGGGASGANSVDSAVEVCRATPDTLTDQQLTLLRNCQVGIFYTNAGVSFPAFRTNLWMCIAGCLGKDPATIPADFTAASYISDIMDN